MAITEQDLFNYVMHPELLDSEKSNSILKNLHIFIEQITFLEEIKENLKLDVPPHLVEKIQDKINHSNVKITVVLFPVYDENKSEFLRYAANSPKRPAQNQFFTFRDVNKDHLIKVNTNSAETKIFLFSSKLEDTDKNISLSFEPAGCKHMINIDEQPLVVDRINEIESIELSYTNRN